MPAVRNGAVLGLGASNADSIAALAEIAQKAQANGFQFVIVSDLLDSLPGN
jgi:polysaccharide deacetylase 2 family uncharacterized protein YibQ